MASGNGGCVYDSIEEHERDALDLTPEKVRALLVEYVLPSYGVLNGAPTKAKMELRDEGLVQVSWRWPGPNHVPLTMGTTAVATPSGARTTCTTQWMIFHAMEAKYKRKSGTENILVYIEGLEHDSAKVTRLGVKGEYDPKTKQVTEWPELLAKYRREAIEVGLLARG